MRFYFEGCDADLSLEEFLLASILGLSLVVVPLFIKFILSFIY